MNKKIFVIGLLLLLGYSYASSQTYWKFQTNPTVTPCGRLTLTSGTPITSADVTGATAVRYTPFVCDTIPLWDGTIWQNVSFTETTLNLGTLTSGKPYDVFAFISSGSLALESLVWTDDTNRATAVTFTDGRLTKSGDKTRLLLGSFYTTSTTTTEDSAAKRYLSNLYNARPRPLSHPTETTDTWTYSTAAYRQANANAANQVNIISTYNLYSTTMRAICGGHNSTTFGRPVACGVGLDSTTVQSAITFGGTYHSSMGAFHAAWFVTTIAPGRHFLAWLEYGAGADTQTWYGDAGSPASQRTGLTGEVWN